MPVHTKNPKSTLSQSVLTLILLSNREKEIDLGKRGKSSRKNKRNKAMRSKSNDRGSDDSIRNVLIH